MAFGNPNPDPNPPANWWALPIDRNEEAIEESDLIRWEREIDFPNSWRFQISERVSDSPPF